MSNYDFSKDLPLGEEAEYQLLNILRKMYPHAYKIVGKEEKYDIVIPAADRQTYHKNPDMEELTIEVKNDVKSAMTGNLAIEIGKVSGALSGITVSQADYWAIRSQGVFYVTRREDLSNYVFNNKFREVAGGDGNRTMMRLVPLSRIRKEAFFKEFANEQDIS